MQNDAELKVAEAAAREAGKRLLAGADELREIEFLSREDVKLRADREAEELLRRLLGARFPYPFYGEEGGGDASLRTRYEPYWMVDPLDGTYNYLRGSALCAVSIGLLRGETPVLGVIYDFNRDICYSGIAAEGFFINGQRVAVRWADSKEQAALATGFPSGMDRSAEVVAALIQRIGGFKKVRMVGSAALALAYVASGIYDVYYEESIRLWDVAAGLAMIQAAGGTVKMRPAADGKPMAYDIWAGKAEFFGSW